jgi:acetoin utilization protein AcuB
MATNRRPDHIPAVAWAMTPFPWFIHVEDRLERAKEVMREQDIRHLPVTRDGELVGIVTARDIQLAESITSDPARREALSVEDVSVLEPYVVDIGQRLDHVLVEMAERRIGSALVTRHGKLAGIFTVTDACRAFGEFLREMFPEGPGDEAA